MDEAAWTQWRGQDDPLAMEAFAAISPIHADSPRSRLHFLHEIDELDGSGLSPIPMDLPQEVRKLFALVQYPEWLRSYGEVEKATANACRIFHEDVVAFVIALLCKSLPECYAGRRGAAVLAYTGALGEPNFDNPVVQDTLVRRVVETAVFVRNVHRHDRWQGTDPVAVRTIHKVRMFHCGVRTMIERRHSNGEQFWDYADLGIPINQQDLVATNLAFALQSIRGVRQLGVKLSDQDCSDIMLHWARIGYHLGIEEPLLRDFLENPQQLWDMVVKHEMNPSVQGHTLTRAMDSFLHLKLFHAFHNAHLPELLMKKLMDPVAQQAVSLGELPKPSGGKLVGLIGAVLFVVHSVFLSIPLVGKWLLNLVGAGIVEITVAAWAGERKPNITLSKELEGV